LYMSHRRLISAVVLVLVCLWPGAADANIGVPFFMFVLGAYWVLLIPVIIVEAIVIHKRLSVKGMRAVGVSAVANVASAILGFAVIFVSEIIFAKAGFEAWYGWLAKVPFFVALVPSYFISVWFEALIAKPIVKLWPYRDLVNAFLVANLYSYALMAILGIVITLPPY